MKRIVFLTLLLLPPFFGLTQSLDYSTRNGHKVITLTINNLKTIVDCSSSQFSNLMKQYGYWPSRDIPASDYTHLIYENNGMDMFLDGNDGLGVNFIEMSETYRHAQIFGALNNVYPQNAFVSLRNSLNPYFVTRTSDGVDKYLIKDGKGGGYLIQIVINRSTHYEVHIQHYTKLV